MFGEEVRLQERLINMVKEKFGQDVVDHVARMVSIPLSRKLLEERTAA